jgi:hypothetical protein
LGSTLVTEGIAAFRVCREVIEFHDTCQLLTGVFTDYRTYGCTKSFPALVQLGYLLSTTRA